MKRRGKDVSVNNDMSKSVGEERGPVDCNIESVKMEYCAREGKEEEKDASGKTTLPTRNISHD